MFCVVSNYIMVVHSAQTTDVTIHLTVNNEKTLDDEV